MARDKAPKPPKPAKEPGRIKQMVVIFKMTRRRDSLLVWYMLLALLAPIGLAVAGALLFSTGIITFVLYIVTGVLAGVLISLTVFGRRAERAAYDQIAGQAGAVGSIMKSALRRSWTGNEMPVNVSPKTQDAVYRAVGKGGVVLIGEGPRSRTERMLQEERRNVARIVPNVEITFLYVGPDEDSTPLHRLGPNLNKIKRTLTKAEVLAVRNRLNSLGKAGLPIPKGIDPLKVRAPRPR